MKFDCSHGLALVRVGLGATFLMSAVGKTQMGWLTTGSHLLGFVHRQQEVAVVPYGGFLGGVVAPNAGVFAQLVVLGEWVAGVSLTLGLLTRLGALTAVWLNLNYLLSKGPLTVDASEDRIFILAALVIAVLAGRMVWSLDAVLRPHLRASVVASWLAGFRPTRAGRLLPWGSSGRSRESQVA